MFFGLLISMGQKKKADSIREIKPQGNSDFFLCTRKWLKENFIIFMSKTKIHHLSYSKPA